MSSQQSTNYFTGVNRPTNQSDKQPINKTSGQSINDNRPSYFTTSAAVQGMSYSQPRVIPIGGGAGYRVPEAQQTILKKELPRYEAALDFAEVSKVLPRERYMEIRDKRDDTRLKASESSYESRASKRLERADKFREFYDETHRSLRLAPSTRIQKYSELGFKSFVVESAKYAARLPGEFAGDLAYVGARVKNVGDALITQQPYTRGEILERVMTIPDIYQSGRSQLESSSKKVTDIAKIIKPIKQSDVITGLVTLRLDKDKRDDITSINIKDTDSSFDPRNVGGIINIVSVASIAGAGKGAIRSARRSISVKRTDQAISNLQKSVTIPNKMYVPGYDIPVGADTKKIEKLLNPRVGPYRREQIANEIGAVRVDNVIVDMSGEQTQLIPKPYRVPDISVEQTPLRYTRSSPPTEGVTEYLGKYTSLPKQPKVAIKEIEKIPSSTKQANLLDEIQIITPDRKITIYDSRFADRFVSPDFNTAVSPRVFKRGMFANKRGSIGGGRQISDTNMYSKYNEYSDVFESSNRKFVSTIDNINVRSVVRSSKRGVRQYIVPITFNRQKNKIYNDLESSYSSQFILRSSPRVDISLKSPLKKLQRSSISTVIPIILSGDSKQKYQKYIDDPITPEPIKKIKSNDIYPIRRINNRRIFSIKLPQLTYSSVKKSVIGSRGSVSRYSPSVVAGVTGQRGNAPEILSGLEVRPI